MATPCDLDWMRGFIAKNTWTFARTMPRHPHEYVVRERVGNNEDFDRFVRLIRANGYQRPFYSKVYISFDLDGWYYWTMGAPLDETIIINRALTTSA